MKKFSILILLLCVLLGGAFGDNEAGIIRYGIFIGSNTGGIGRVPLEYAVSDAQAIANVLYEMGGLQNRNSIMLANPSLNEVCDGFAEIQALMDSMKTSARRLEFIVYYSGHSDETGLLLGNDILFYKDLKDMITDAGADVNIAILDSCSSGTFTRLKGGRRDAPFLIDESNETSGHAFITSSSADEAAQESDALRASYFTHYLISALRGAADNTQDGVVTIHEAYSYASAETQSTTQNTQAGPQHPSYDMKLSGSGGELVLTDLRSTSAGMTFAEELSGKIYIKDYSGRLVLEARKHAGSQLRIAIPPGMYYVTLSNPDDHNSYSEAVIQLGFSDNRNVAESDFTPTDRTATRSRGVDIEDIEAEHEEPKEVSFSDFIRPLVGFVKKLQKPEVSKVSINFVTSTKRVDGLNIGLLNFTAGDVHGLQAAAISNVCSGNVHGFQAAGTFNISDGDSRGGQAAGVFNINGGDSRGLQSSGVFNINAGNTSGFQGSGVFNMNAGDMFGAQAAGVFNTNSGNFRGFQGAGVFNINDGQGKGVQAAGVFNINRDPFRGAQLSGVFNIADTFAGVQISLVNTASNYQGVQVGLVNIANDVAGTQIGLVNINNDISGIPVGLFNFSRQGLRNPSMWLSASGDLLGGFQIGTKSFYTLLFAGANTADYDNILISGIGLGVRIPVSRLVLEADYSIKQYVQESGVGDAIYASLFEWWESGHAFVSAIRLNAGVKFGRVYVFLGMTLDVHNTFMYGELPDYYPKTDPWDFDIGGMDFDIYHDFHIGIQI
ncbi:MAG: caspase family protein [Spirochaetales bacterium]|nr:caspase family protein [Spirochaetales bacterium]